MWLMLPLWIERLDANCQVVMRQSSQMMDSTLQHLRTNSCDRTAWARQIMDLYFSRFGRCHSFRSVTNNASLDRSTSTNIAKTFVGVSQGLRLGKKHVVCTTHHWPTPLWGADVKILYNFVHKCRKLQIYLTQNLTFVASLLAKKKIMGHYFLGNLCIENTRSQDSLFSLMTRLQPGRSRVDSKQG
jgi:hypothetical protein